MTVSGQNSYEDGSVLLIKLLSFALLSCSTLWWPQDTAKCISLCYQLLAKFQQNEPEMCFFSLLSLFSVECIWYFCLQFLSVSTSGTSLCICSDMPASEGHHPHTCRSPANRDLLICQHWLDVSTLASGPSLLNVISTFTCRYSSDCLLKTQIWCLFLVFNYTSYLCV